MANEYTYDDWQFLAGCDPEIFITKNGRPASAHEFLPGTKDKPCPTETGAIQVDGIAAEFNVNPVGLWGYSRYESPSINEQFLVWNNRILQQLDDIRSYLPTDHSLSLRPVCELSPKFLESLPEYVKALGCDPDYNAYTLEENPRPNEDTPFRTAAGHLHIGWGDDIPPMHPEHTQICATLVKMLDATVGIFMTYLDRDPRRRELYGKAGAFRPKPYGVEYRTPSNLWLMNYHTRAAVWFLMQYAILSCKNESSPEAVLSCYLWDNPQRLSVQDIINKGAHKEAKAWLSHFARRNWKFYPIWKPIEKRVSKMYGDSEE